MPRPLASLGSLVHPHQIEIQEFASYALVIDARSAEAYQEDHVPGAISLPVGAASWVDRRSGLAMAAQGVGVSEAAPSLPYGLAARVQHLSPGASVLVYCDRGGLDSLQWAAPLRAAGFRVDVLGGGWGNYRRWVTAGLEVLPRMLTFRRLVAPPAGGLCLVLDRMVRQGEQVIDVPALAGQELVPGLTLPGDKTPSQAAFDTRLLEALRPLDPQRPVWIRDGMVGAEGVVLPPSLRDALLRATGVQLEIPVPVRAAAWLERLQGRGITLTALCEAFSASARPPAPEVLDRWRSLATAGQAIDALGNIILSYIDAHPRAVDFVDTLRVVRLESLQPRAVTALVHALRDGS
jgi:tRNA 2-selenouridine synthase